MRIRKKKYLDERINQNSDLLIAMETTYSNALDFIKEKEYINYSSLFSNDNPIEMDLGCGFGAFLIEKAKQNPNINFIGVEKTENVIVSAMEKVRTANLKNVRFLNIRVECLEKYIPSHSISTIYLNFSNPLPNTTAEKQRLTYKRFLNIYKELLILNGKIIQKTDEKDFFDYSIESFKSNGFTVDEINYDLEKNPIDNDIKTEHELKYINNGKKINRLVAYPSIQ